MYQIVACDSLDEAFNLVLDGKTDIATFPAGIRTLMFYVNEERVTKLPSSVISLSGFGCVAWFANWSKDARSVSRYKCNTTFEELEQAFQADSGKVLKFKQEK